MCHLLRFHHLRRAHTHTLTRARAHSIQFQIDFLAIVVDRFSHFVYVFIILHDAVRCHTNGVSGDPVNVTKPNRKHQTAMFTICIVRLIRVL